MADPAILLEIITYSFRRTPPTADCDEPLSSTSSFSMKLVSNVMHVDQRCSSAVSPELKKTGSFLLTHSLTDVTTHSSDRK